MKMFALPKGTIVHILHMSVRREKHGKAKVPAMDIKCSVTAPNTLIDQLKGEEWRCGLFVRPSKSDPDQGRIEGVPDVSDAERLRLTGIDPIHLTDELSGYAVTIDIGTGRKESAIEFNGCKVNQFNVEPFEGGTVRVGFRVQASRVGKREIGEIGVLVDSPIEMTMEPPTDGAGQVIIPETEMDATVDFRHEESARPSKLQKRISTHARKAETPLSALKKAVAKKPAKAKASK